MAQITPITATGASASSAWAGGKGNFSLTGNFGGGSARVEYSFDETTWVPIEAPTMGELGIVRNKGFNFELPACDLRVVVVNADTSALNLTANIETI